MRKCLGLGVRKYDLSNHYWLAQATYSISRVFLGPVTKARGNRQS
jgi:hypothetical protein